jgi:hypothetical protein
MLTCPIQLIHHQVLILYGTFELKTGGLKDSSAFLVLPKKYNSATKKTSTIAVDSQVTGEWNVRIKENNGKTTINVNIVNVKYDSWDLYTKRNRENILTTYRSTGVFESLISQAIK